MDKNKKICGQILKSKNRKNRQRIIIAYETITGRNTTEAIFIENYENESFLGKNVCIAKDGGFYTEESNYVKFWQTMPSFPN